MSIVSNKLVITPGYIQAAFDGEGCLSLSHHQDREWWALGISNTDLLWLENLKGYLQGLGYHPVLSPGRIEGRGNKTLYVLSLKRRIEIERFLEVFPPLMAARQEKAAQFRLWLKRCRLTKKIRGTAAVKEAMAIMKRESRELI